MLQSFQCAVDLWLPGFGDPTVTGWAATVGYFGAAFLAFAATGGGANGLPKKQHAFVRFWQLMTVLLVLLGINKQLDLHSLGNGYLRCAAQSGGWYQDRHWLQAIFVVIFPIAGAALVLAASWCFRGVLKANAMAVIGTILIASFVVLRAVSFNHLDQLIGADVPGETAGAVLELTGIALIAINAGWLVRRR